MFDFLFYVIWQIVQWELLVLALLVLSAIWLFVGLFILGGVLNFVSNSKAKKEESVE